MLPLGRVFGKIGVPSLLENVVSDAKYSARVLLLLGYVSHLLGRCARVLLLSGICFSSPRQMALLLPSGQVTKREGPGILLN